MENLVIELLLFKDFLINREVKEEIYFFVFRKILRSVGLLERKR